jgi:predicted nucleic acid-binding protein
VIVLDASFLVGYYNERDSHHAVALSLMKRIAGGECGTGLLLEYVFLEVVNVLLARRDLATAIRATEALLGAREFEFVPCSDLFGRALGAFRSQRGTKLSFSDTVIVVAALDRADGLVATFDAEFRKVPGITVVPE